MRLKKLFLGGIVCGMMLMASCGNKNNPEQPQSDNAEQAAVDSLAIALHEIDSIMNGGQLIHLDIYEIGKIKNVSVSVQKLSAGNESTIWINFRKDCGGEYYYSWEDAHLLNEECSYLLDAINTILANKDRAVDHEERYAYITKDDIRVMASASAGKPWTMNLSVDYAKQNSTITLTDSDITDLKTLIQKSQEKILQLQ